MPRERTYKRRKSFSLPHLGFCCMFEFNSYRRLSLKYHPDKNKSPDADAKFYEVAEAYDVLCSGKNEIRALVKLFHFSQISIAERKARYDKFGEEGLKGGVPTAECDFLEGYTFHGDARRVFKEFFGGENPFSGV